MFGGKAEKKVVSNTRRDNKEPKNAQRAQVPAGRAAPIAPVLRPGGRKSTLSDGCVLLSGSITVDLQAAERFRILRTRIEKRGLNGSAQQVIAMSSAIPEEGKSVVAVNLARAFGMDPQGKTLLIDCDLRKPNVHRFFDEMQSPGLSDVLVAGKPIRNVIRSVEPGLDLLSAGSPVVDSTRTIEQPGLAMLINELRKHYRYIVLDCPPALLCSEPLTLANLADTALLVVRSWRTQKKLVRDAVNALGKESLMGIVLNESTDTLQQYGYYSYYGYDKEAIVKARLHGQKQLPRGTKQKRGFLSRIFARKQKVQKVRPKRLTPTEAIGAWKQKVRKEGGRS